MRFHITCITAVLATVAFSQTPRNLADYLTSNPWKQAESGPLFMLDPTNVESVNSEGGFASYDRKKVKVGDLTVLAPRTMVMFDDSLSQEPNLYDGLPMYSKVLYLLQGLNEEQWHKVSSTGIGLVDLQGEQKRVFQSILPKPFTYDVQKVATDRSSFESLSQSTLSDEDLAKVRLKVERDMEFRPLIAGKENAYSYFVSEYVKGKPDDVSYRRINGFQPPTDVFGARIRTTVDNKLKASQLDYSFANLAATIEVPEATTIGEILRTIGAACGLEIIPDFRLAQLPVRFYGSKATAHDLLQAIALSIEGTYRRLDSSYVLTADIMGMATRQYRIDYFTHMIQHEIEQREALWRHDIGARSGFSKVSFNSSDVLAPTEALATEVEKADRHVGIYNVSTELMTPRQREELDEWERQPGAFAIQKDKIGIASKYSFHFVLPGGIEMLKEQDLGTARYFGPKMEQASTPVPNLPIVLSKDQKLTFLVATEDVAGAKTILATLVKLPVARLWLDTHSSAALSAAVKLAKGAGIEIGLALRPWRARTDTPDCTILGERGQTVVDRVASLEQTQILYHDLSGQVGFWMAPSSSTVEEEWRHDAELASTHGICGVTLLETQPLGYEPTRPNWVSFFGTINWGAAAHGYTTTQRLSFLRQKGIDPVDLGDDLYGRSAFMDHPFLKVDYPVRDTLQAMAGDWRTYLANMNLRATEKLVSVVGDKVTYFEQRLTSINMLWQRPNPIVEWKVGMPLPLTLPLINDQILAKNTGYRHVYLPMDPALQGPRAPGTWISNLPPRDGSPLKGNPLLIDLELIPLRQLPSTIGKWFKIE